MNTDVGVRGATLEDRRALWEWRNDPVTRGMFRPNETVGYEQHCSWFEGILMEGRTGLFIGILDNLRIGCVRFRPIGAREYEAFLYLKPAYCGKGYAAPMLRKSIDHLAAVRSPGKIAARVSKNHGPARRLFEQAGFSVQSETETELYCELKFQTDSNPAAGKQAYGERSRSYRPEGAR